MNLRLISETPPSIQPAGIRMRTVFFIVAGVAAIGMAGFAGWFANGDTLFWSLLQSGLAWCL